MAATPQDVLGYWKSVGPAKWFARNDAFDAALRLRFEPTHHAAARGEYDHWTGTPDGVLALLILLDQVPRNIYRNSAHSYATDPKARAIARAAIAAGFDRQVERGLVQVIYLPFEHSEDLADQEEALALFATLDPAPGDEDPMKWAKIHYEIIARFGRFPHRNAALGRTTTPEEQQFLDDGGFSG